jgi:hypothetical protein
MPDPRLIRVYYEGDDDRSLLQGLQLGKLLPTECELALRQDKKRAGGREGLLAELAPFVRPENGVAGRAIVVLDLDDNTPEKLAAWFRRQLIKALRAEPASVHESKSPRPGVVMFSITKGPDTGRAAIVPLGLPDDEELRKTLGVERFAIDDYVLRLVRDKGVYEAVSDLEGAPYDVAMRKMTEIADLLRENRLAVRQSKRLLHIVRATAGVRPSSAEFISQLMKAAVKTLTDGELRSRFSPLVDDIGEAARLLAQSP